MITETNPPTTHNLGLKFGQTKVCNALRDAIKNKLITRTKLQNESTYALTPKGKIQLIQEIEAFKNQKRTPL